MTVCQLQTSTSWQCRAWKIVQGLCAILHTQQ